MPSFQGVGLAIPIDIARNVMNQILERGRVVLDEKAGQVEGVSTSHVELVWDPPWSPDLMSEAAKLELGMI